MVDGDFKVKMLVIIRRGLIWGLGKVTTCALFPFPDPH